MELDVWLDLAVIVQPLVLSLVVEVAGGADDGVVDVDGGERGEGGGLAVEQVLVELLQPDVVDEIVLREFHVGREAGAVVEVVKLGFSGGDLEEIISLRSINFVPFYPLPPYHPFSPFLSLISPFDSLFRNFFFPCVDSQKKSVAPCPQMGVLSYPA